MNPLALTQELEERLEERLVVEGLKDAKGNEKVNRENYKKMQALLQPYLVDEETLRAISGGLLNCSMNCGDEG